MEISPSFSITNVRNLSGADVDESASVTKPPTFQNRRKSLYFEAKILDANRQKNKGISIGSDDQTVVCLMDEGVILSPNGIIPLGNELFQVGDIIGCRVLLDIYKSGSQDYHHVIFSSNGVEIGYPVIFEGNPPISVGIVQDDKYEGAPINEMVNLNFGDRPFQHSFGNYTLFPQ